MACWCLVSDHRYRFDVLGTAINSIGCRSKRVFIDAGWLHGLFSRSRFGHSDGDDVQRIASLIP